MKEKAEYRRIKQIMPPEGWLAVYKDCDTGKEFSSPLVAWAMVEEIDGSISVVGLDAAGCVDFADEADNMIRYEHPSRFTRGLQA